MSLKQEKDCVLVAGPVWSPINIITGEDFEEERVKPLIDNFFTATGENKSPSKEAFLTRMGNLKKRLVVSYYI